MKAHEKELCKVRKAQGEGMSKVRKVLCRIEKGNV